MKKLLIALPFLFILFSCTPKKNTEVKKDVVLENLSDNLLNATAWAQQSAEAYAAYIQTFNLAKKQLMINLQETTTDLPNAVIVDIDETMLDNSPFEGYLIKKGLSYNHENWKRWVALEKAKSTPGALDFANFAKDNNVEIFYISNRSVDDFEPTLKNLKRLNFPFADNKHLLLKDTISDKSPRRDLVAKTHEVIMLMGDNLRDLSEEFKARDENFGKNSVDATKSLFGTKYFIFPNPMYGEWTKAYKSTSKEQQLVNMRDRIEGF